MRDFTITQQPWQTCEPQLEELLAKHNKLVSQFDPRIPYKLDTELCRRMAEAGVLKVWTACDVDAPGVVIGYCIWFLTTSMESAGLSVAQQGPWFVRPKAGRSGLGWEIMFHSLYELKAEGVKVVYPHFWGKSPGGQRLGRRFEQMGAVAFETSYSLNLDDLPPVYLEQP